MTSLNRRDQAPNHDACEHNSAAGMKSTACGSSQSPSNNRNGNERGFRRFSRYVSTLPRRIIPCDSDKNSVLALVDLLTKENKKRVDEKIVNEKGESSINRVLGQDCTAFDRQRPCCYCGGLMIAEGDDANVTDLHYRRVVVHTLLYGSAGIDIADVRCPHCQELNYYDGRCDGLFALSMSDVFSRELIDFWLYGVAAIGSTFRESYEMSRKISDSSSAKFARWGGSSLSCTREQGNNALSAFLSTIEYPSDIKTSRIFTCDVCEERDSDGNLRTNAVVMYGTATGVLGDLPSFSRSEKVTTAASHTAKAQFILPTRALRKYVQSFFESASSRHKEKEFEVPLPSPDIAESVAELFFYDGPHQDDASFGTALHQLMRAAYIATDMFEGIVNLSHNYSSRKTVIVRNRLCNASLRSALADFSAGYLFESVPSAIITNVKQHESAFRIANALDRFRRCSHFHRSSSAQSVVHVCSDCTEELVNAVSDEAEYLSHAVRVISGIVEAQFEADDTPIRVLASYVSCVLRRCYAVYKNYQSVYASRQDISCTNYNSKYAIACVSSSNQPSTFNNDDYVSTNDVEEGRTDHELISALQGHSTSITNSEAAKTGDIFPGRPQVRPRVTFKKQPGEGCRQICAKDYRHSPSCTHGLLTVVCTCEHPKVLGCTVMEESESLSTAK